MSEKNVEDEPSIFLGLNFNAEDSADDQSDQVMESFQIMIQCQNEAEQSASLETLINQGFKCRALNS